MFLSSESLKNDEFLELLDPSTPTIKRYMTDPIYISVLGPDSSGKTSLIKAQIFLHRTEDCCYDKTRKDHDGQETIIPTGEIKQLEIPCTLFEISNDDYHKVAYHPQMISKSEGYIILVDASDMVNTYAEVDKLMKTVATFHDKDIPMYSVLVGNKIDDVKNQKKMKNNLASISDKFFKVPYFEVSCSLFEGVETPFTTVIKKILKNRKEAGFIEKRNESFDKK